MKEHLDTFKKRYDPIHHAYWTDVLSDTALAAWHQEQLREVIGHVKLSSPFYARHLAQVDERSLTLDDLVTLPFTTNRPCHRFAIRSVAAICRVAGERTGGNLPG